MRRQLFVTARRPVSPAPLGPHRRGHSGKGHAISFAAAFSVAVSTVALGAPRTPDRSERPPRASLETREDRDRSPFTGYTRRHWLEITEKLIAGFLPYFDEETGMPRLVGTPGETGHFQHLFDVTGEREAFGRSLTMVAFYTAATGRDQVRGYEGSIVEPYLRAIVRGTDPHDPHYWGPHPPTDVMGTNVATAVLASPRFFWDPLTEPQRQNLLAYLQDLARTRAYDNNHWYFHMVAAPILDRAGKDSHRAFLTSMFRRLLAWYRGDGWFIDGSNHGFDLYNLWGFQLYNQQLVRYDEEWRREFGAEVNRTTARFLRGFPYLFGRDGGPIPWGRSTTYRFALLSALGWAQLNGANTLSPGLSRRIASGCLKYFWEHGCLSANGLLEPGYRGPNSVVAEPYIDRGAPYWAAQGLVILMIPEADPFWTAREEPMPADGAGGRVALPGAQMMVRVSPIDGEARLYPVGQPFSHWGRWQRGIKYCQLAYSSFLGWCATGEGGPDLGAGRTGVSLDGRTWRFRERPRMIEVADDHLFSRETLDVTDEAREKAGWDDSGELSVHTLVGDDGEVHVFWHDCPRPLYLYLGGYGISVPHGASMERSETRDQITIAGGGNHSVVHVVQGPDPGRLDAELLEPRPGWLHSHNFGGRGAFPHWESAAPVPSNRPVVVYVNGTRARAPVVPAITVRTEGDTMRVTFEGRRFEVRVPLNQLRCGPQKAQVWGMQAWRWIARQQEESQWQLIPRQNTGRMYQLGELRGIHDLPPARHIELLRDPPRGGRESHIALRSTPGCQRSLAPARIGSYHSVVLLNGTRSSTWPSGEAYVTPLR
jgi:hypothetical protein